MHLPAESQNNIGMAVPTQLADNVRQLFWREYLFGYKNGSRQTIFYSGCASWPTRDSAEFTGDGENWRGTINHFDPSKEGIVLSNECTSSVSYQDDSRGDDGDASDSEQQ